VSVWFRGHVTSNEAVPLADDRGLLVGDGLFETVLVRRGTPQSLRLHLARMARSAKVLGVTVPDELETTISHALPRLLDLEAGPSRAALRVTVTRGRGRGLDPSAQSTLLLFLEALPDTPPTPASARIVATPRIDPSDPLAGHKTLSRMAYVEARRSALATGADLALLPTIDGDVCEADAANLFVVLCGAVVTPPLDRGVLPGVTRARCLAALAATGSPALEERLTRADLARAEEAFVTSSLAGVRPLRSIDGRSLPSAGGVARRLADCLESA
jgi:branched-subunit amino acid aminotransferase/4-amino-4-deoxychorismate lyase